MAKRATPAPEHDPHRVGERLESTRRALGINKSTICERAGLHNSQWTQWIQGRNLPAVPFAIRLCDEFSLTLDWIYRADRSGLPSKLVDELVKVERQALDAAADAGRVVRFPEGAPAPHRSRR